jgi:large subunit ribosomal protein L9
MKVLLIKDVYKLGQAGDVKKVAAGFGRNYLLPQGLAVLATPGALKQADNIRKAAAVERARLNQELGGVAEQIEGLELTFPARAGETGKLYGSVSTRMIVDAIQAQLEVEVSPRQIDTQPIRKLGVHTVPIRLTLDLVPEIKVLVHREGEAPSTAYEEEERLAEEAAAEEAAAEEEAEAVEYEVEAAEEQEEGAGFEEDLPVAESDEDEEIDEFDFEDELEAEFEDD